MRRPGRLAALAAIALGLAFALAFAAAMTVLMLNRERPIEPAAVPPDPADPALVAQGAYLALVGHCAGCHTARGGPPYAGGRVLPTPFGSVVAGNLTPDDDTGLGRWSADDFRRALHQGRSRDGRLLVPAFPYAAYTHVSRADSDALWAYLRSLPPVRREHPPHALRFPFNTQAALALWRALYFQPAEPGPGSLDAAPAPATAGLSSTSDMDEAAVLRRGAYLVRGLGHCAECHAERNLLGAPVQPERLAGGAMPLQGWTAPALAPTAPGVPGVPGAQAAAIDDLVTLLRSGQNRHGSATGPMAEVVFNSTQHWREADLRAAALYLNRLPPLPAPRDPVPAADPAQIARGAALYPEHCADCHGPQGEGVPGVYPPLAGNPSVTQADPANALQMLRYGGFPPATASHPRPYGMPPAELTPQQSADVLSFVRQSWGNRAAPVMPQQVLR